MEIKPLGSFWQSYNEKAAGSDKQTAEKQDDKFQKSAQELEALFISHIIKAMEQTMPENSFTGSGNNLAKMMFSSVMGQAVAEQGGLGLAPLIAESLRDKAHDALTHLVPAVDANLLYQLRSTGSRDE